MFLSDLSIKQPVFATMMMVALAVLGITSYRQLKVDMFPNVEFPIVTVTTVYPGASPETVEREVTKRIEESINTVQGIKHIESTSQEGLSNIVVLFNLEVSTQVASQDIRGKVAGIRGDLPREIEEPIVQRIDPGAMPIVSVAVNAPGLAPCRRHRPRGQGREAAPGNRARRGRGEPGRRGHAGDPGRGGPRAPRGLSRLTVRRRDGAAARERGRARPAPRTAGPRRRSCA
jgi:hypothetical protein